MTQDPNTISMRLGIDDAQTMFPAVMKGLAGVDETDILGVLFRCVYVQTERHIPHYGAPEQWFVTLQFQRLFPIHVAEEADQFKPGDPVILMEVQPLRPNAMIDSLPRGCVGRVLSVSNATAIVDFGSIGRAVCDVAKLSAADPERFAKLAGHQRLIPDREMPK